MIIDTRHECVDFIARSIRKTAEWRLSLAKRFPGDARNTRAAERLAEIANEATELPDRIWEGLRPHFHWADERFSEACSQANRNVVLRHDIKNFDAYLASLMGAEVSALSMVAGDRYSALPTYDNALFSYRRCAA